MMDTFLRVFLAAGKLRDSTFVAMMGPPSKCLEFVQTGRGGAYCASPCQDRNELFVCGDVLVHNLLRLGVCLIQGSLGICHIAGQVSINRSAKLIPQGGLESRYCWQDLHRIGGLNNICNGGS